MSIDVEQFMSNLRVHLLRTHCFYGNVLAQLPTVFDNKSVPTLGVGKSNRNELLVKLFVNPDYIEHVIDVCNRDKKKVVDHFTEVLKHEIHHLIFEHLTLMLPDKSRQTAATECSVNSYIDRNLLVPEDGQEKAGVFPEDFGLQPKLGVHEYYALLEGNKKFMKMRGQEIKKQLALPKKKKEKTEEQKKLDELAEEQEKASKETASGNKTGDEQKKQQDSISQKTQDRLSQLGGIIPQIPQQSQNGQQNPQQNQNGQNGQQNQQNQNGQNQKNGQNGQQQPQFGGMQSQQGQQGNSGQQNQSGQQGQSGQQNNSQQGTTGQGGQQSGNMSGTPSMGNGSQSSNGTQSNQSGMNGGMGGMGGMGGQGTSDDSDSQEDTPQQKAEQKLQEARELQDEATEDLQNGDMDSASEKQHQAAKKIQQASDALGQTKGNGQQSNEDGDGDGGDGDGEGGIPMIDDHGMWDSVAGDEITNGMIKDIIRQANETCKQMNSWGNLPGEIKDAIDNAYAIEREIVPWEVVLKNFVASSSENILDYTMKRKSKRYDTRPGTKKDDVLSVAIGIDTSGSIDNEMLGVFFNELRWIDKTGTKMTVFEWDTQVNREYDFHEFDGTVSGRGGTDPTDFLETVSERKFDCVIIFTDLYFSNVEKEYGIPMLWVCDRGGCSFGDDYDFPVKEGIIMKVNDDRDGFEVVRM